MKYTYNFLTIKWQTVQLLIDSSMYCEHLVYITENVEVFVFWRHQIHVTLDI